MLADDLERAAHLIAHHTEPVLARLEITQGEAHVLAQLAYPGALSLNELHREFGHKRSTLTSIIDRLEQRGLVARGPHPSDRRSILITLSARGRRCAKEIAGAREQLEGLVRERVSARDLAAVDAIVSALASIASTRN